MRKMDLLAKALLLRESDERNFYEVLDNFKTNGRKVNTCIASDVTAICDRYAWATTPAARRHIEKILEAYVELEDKCQEYGLRII